MGACRIFRLWFLMCAMESISWTRLLKPLAQRRSGRLQFHTVCFMGCDFHVILCLLSDSPLSNRFQQYPRFIGCAPTLSNTISLNLNHPRLSNIYHSSTQSSDNSTQFHIQLYPGQSRWICIIQDIPPMPYPTWISCCDPCLSVQFQHQQI